MKSLLHLILGTFLLAPSILRAEPDAPAAEDPVHAELRSFRDSFGAALNKKDLPAILKHLHPNVVVTFQNAQVARGHEGVRKHYSKMLEGSDKMVEDYQAKISVDELTILHGGDAGISFGAAAEHFKLTSGLEFDLNSRWTATLVKENGAWLIASLHASTDLFDNPLLNTAKATAYWAGGACLAGGLLLGWFVGRRRRG